MSFEIKYLAVEKGELNHALPDAMFPILAAKYPHYTLSVDENGETVRTLQPNATLADRIQWQHLNPNNPAIKQASTASQQLANIWKAKDGVFDPAYTQAFNGEFHIISIYVTENDFLEDIQAEITGLRQAVNAQNGGTTQKPEGTLLTLANVNKMFEQLSIE